MCELKRKQLESCGLGKDYKMSEKISIKQNAVLVNATSGVRGEGLPSGHQRAMYLLATARPNGETFQKARTESLASWLKGIADTANKMEQDVSIEISRSQNGTPTHVGNIPVSALAGIANPASKPEAVASAQA